MDQVAREVSLTLPKKKLTTLIIDKNGWTEKGEKRVGVGRQYCGNVGKAANCQVALNFLVSSFILKEKLLNKEDIPLLSAKDVKELVIFQLYKQISDEQMYHKIIHRHIRRQKDINRAYLRQNTNLSK